MGRFGTAMRVELRKMATTRMWWILLLVMVAYVGMIAVFITFSFGSLPDEAQATGAPSLDDRQTVLALYSVGLPLGYVFPVILGVLAMTGEYRYQTLTPTFLAEPRRMLVVLSKLVVALLVGLVFGVVGIGTSVAGAAPVVALTDHAALLDGEMLRALGQAVLGMALWAGIGVGIGALLRNQITAIVVILAFSQLVEPLARVGLNAWSVTRDVAQYLPGAAADSMAGASLYTLGTTVDMLDWWQGGLVLAGYAALFALLGGWSMLRRDVA